MNAGSPASAAWPAKLLAALDEAGSGGDLILSRSTGHTPVADLQRAKAAFERYLSI